MKVIHRLMEKKKRDLENQIQHRSESVEFEVKEDKRTLSFPFSSEEPVNRGVLGNEILDHGKDSINFERLNSQAPLLLNHQPDKIIGVVQRGWLDSDKRRGMVEVKFANNALGKETLEMVNDGILRNVSVGYSIEKTQEEKNRDGYFRAVDWTPAEVSVVSIPADYRGAGIGRAKEIDTNTSKQQESSNMSTEQRESAVASQDAPQNSKPDSKTQMESTATDLKVVREEASKKAASDERNRIRQITVVCNEHQLGEELKETFIAEGKSINDVRDIALNKIKERSQKVESVADPIDYSQEKGVDYSIAAGIRGALTGDWTSKEAGFVRELSQEVERSGVKRTSERSFLIPYTALTKRATYVTSSGATGGNLVETDLRDGDFIENLKNNTLMMGMGVQSLPGLVGDVAIPRRSGSATAYWLANETTAITQSESTFDQISLTPKTAGVLSKFSRQTLLQATPGIEQLIRTDLSNTVNLAVDLAILNGSGSSGQPTGIMQTSGIGSVAGGTNGAQITLENLINLEKEVLIDNAGGNNMGYVTNAKVLAKLKQLRAGGSAAGDGAFLWNTDLNARGRGSTPGVINGYQIGVTNQVPSNLTKGSASSVCSAVLFGDFSQALVGFWGNGMEIAVSDADGTDFTKALVSVRALTTLDVAVRQASAFSAILDVLT